MSVAPAIRDRIKEFRRVKASDILASPRNWRFTQTRSNAILGKCQKQLRVLVHVALSLFRLVSVCGRGLLALANMTVGYGMVDGLQRGMVESGSVVPQMGHGGWKAHIGSRILWKSQRYLKVLTFFIAVITRPAAIRLIYLLEPMRIMIATAMLKVGAFHRRTIEAFVILGLNLIMCWRNRYGSELQAARVYRQSPVRSR